MSLTNYVRPADGKRVSARSVRDLLSGRVGAEVSVTAGKPGTFLYAATAEAAAAAESTAREVLAQQGLAADIQVERWDPSRRAWLPTGGTAAAELPPRQDRGPGRKRLRAAGAVVAAIFDGLGNAGS